MAPEQEQIINKNIEEIAQILYQNTEADELKDFETIELTVRKQIIAYVAPKIGNFFFKKCRRKQSRERKNHQKLSWRHQNIN
jgi:hypothetical protein